MKYNKYLIIGLLFIFCKVNAQVRIGEWVDHLSFNYANSLTKVGNIVYYSNGKGLAKYNTDDNSSEKLTKINGLSDVNIKLVRKCSYNDYVLVIYDNTNIDVIKPDGTIINISDIKRKSITGKKVINSVYFSGKYAYIACGFGIVVFDFDKLEVRDTYYVGSTIKNYGIYQITKNDTAFVVASDSGIYYGNFSASLINPLNWKSLNFNLPKGPYNAIVNINGKLFTNYSEKIKSDQFYKDTLYQFNSNIWTKSTCFVATGSTNNELIEDATSNQFFACSRNIFSVIDANGVTTNTVLNYVHHYSDINDVYYVGGNEFWFADGINGLVNTKIIATTNISNILKINGPGNNLVNDLAIKDGKLAVAPVNLTTLYNEQYNRSAASYFADNEWHSLADEIPVSSIVDINSVAIDPNDKNHIAFACMSTGIVELKNNKLSQIYTYTNSPLTPAIYLSNPLLRVTGLNFDNNSNLWNLVTVSPYVVQILKKDGSWKLMDFSQFTPSSPTVSKVIFTKNNQAWVVLARGGGILIYSDVNGLSAPNASNTKVAKQGVGLGNLPSNEVSSLCEDLDGKIWVGTDKGVAIFYSQDNVFSGSNWDCQQILIEQDGHVQHLLEDDAINTIAVDGANRKWVGTENSGVYCFSPDGQTEIYHFTFENSPLYSNSIMDIVIDETTGDVFIGSELGIQSFRTPIIKGFEDFSTIHAYPNPIRPGTTNTVYIKGLVDECIVKITDVAGNLIWETKSQGGQIQWDMQNFSGARVVSGTYLINCSTANGELKGTTKLLVVN